MATISAPMPKPDESGVDGDQPSGFAHRCDNWREVERAQNAHVDHLGRAADLAQDVGRAHRLEHAVRRRHDGDVFALADDARAVERILVVAFGHVPVE